MLTRINDVVIEVMVVILPSLLIEYRRYDISVKSMIDNDLSAATKKNKRLGDVMTNMSPLDRHS